MDQISSNSLTPALLQSQFGLDINNANDRALLTSPISSAAVQARFPQFALVPVNGTLTVPSVYPGFPAAQQLQQALRNVPQWGGVSPWLGPPLGKTWYDSMQVKVTKRYSHGLQAAGNFTWAKGQVLGAASDSTYYLSGQALTTDIYNYANNKQLNQYVRPLAMTITFSYTTPKLEATGFGMKALSQVVRDWQYGAVLRYQSGVLIGDPSSLNLLTQQLGRVAGGFTSTFGNNFQNLTGQPLFTIQDPNCHCFNPQTAQVLNPGAWTDAPAGTWGTSAPFYNSYRWQRWPAESMSFGRNFRMGKEGKYNLQVRAEFQNIFNRLLLSPPAVANTNPALPIATTNSSGNIVNSSGFGTIATVGGIGDTTTQGVRAPRNGQVIARFTF
jgi:hypothetical protein